MNPKQLLAPVAIVVLVSACSQSPSGSTQNAAPAATSPAGSGASQASALTPQPAAASAAPALAPSAAPAAARPAADVKPAEPAFRDVTVPAGTLLQIELKTAVASDTSHAEDPVRGALRHAVTVGGVTAIPVGTVATGHVTDATRSARVKGVAHVAFRFNQLDLPGEGKHVSIRTAAISREAHATKKKDAAKIGGGAAGGALIGALVGGGSGAAKGAAVGGAAGTGVVLATRGDEIRIAPGASFSVKLLDPITVQVAR
jgi:hypothetical protein